MRSIREGSINMCHTPTVHCNGRWTVKILDFPLRSFPFPSKLYDSDSRQRSLLPVSGYIAGGALQTKDFFWTGTAASTTRYLNHEAQTLQKVNVSTRDSLSIEDAETCKVDNEFAIKVNFGRKRFMSDKHRTQGPIT